MAAVETILTITGDNFDPEGANEVWIDGKRAQILSSDEGRLRVSGPFPEVATPRDVSVTVVSGNQASNAHSLRLVPPATLDREGAVPLLGTLVGSVLVDDTPGKERLLLLSPLDGIFEFSRESLTTKPWVEHPGVGVATAIAGPDSEGKVYVATHHSGIMEVFEVAASGAVRPLMYRDNSDPIVLMALNGDDELLLVPEESCRVSLISLELRPHVFDGTLTVADCNEITGMASTEDSLYLSIDDGPDSRVEKRDWDDLDAIAQKWVVSPVSTIGAKDDQVLALAGSRMLRLHESGFDISDNSTFEGAVGIHIGEDGLFLSFYDNFTMLMWTEPFKTGEAMEEKQMVRIPVPFRQFKGTDAFYFGDIQGAQRVTAEGEFRPLPPDYMLVSVDRRGYPLVLDYAKGLVQRYDPVEDVATTLLDLDEEGVASLTGMSPVGDSLVFLYHSVTGPGIGRMKSDGSGLEMKEVDSTPINYLFAGRDNRIYLLGVETNGVLLDGIWSFDAQAPVTDDLPDLRRDFAYTWNGDLHVPFEDSKGRILLSHLGASALTQEIDHQQGSIRPLIPEDGEMIVAVLDEDASGRLLVMWLDPFELRIGLGHLYR